MEVPGIARPKFCISIHPLLSSKKEENVSLSLGRTEKRFLTIPAVLLDSVVRFLAEHPQGHVCTFEKASGHTRICRHLELFLAQISLIPTLGLVICSFIILLSVK